VTGCPEGGVGEVLWHREQDRVLAAVAAVVPVSVEAELLTVADEVVAEGVVGDHHQRGLMSIDVRWDRDDQTLPEAVGSCTMTS
jgi:hypothetical protein